MKTILIASKGRAGNSAILDELNEAEEKNAYVFVEPQDEPEYRAAWPNLNMVVLDENDGGLPYVRNVMLTWAALNGMDWYWNLDDDVRLFEVVDEKTVARPYTALGEAEQYFVDDPEVGQAGLEYGQFAWSAGRDYVDESYCDCVVCNNVHHAISNKLVFDEESLLKLDRDFTLQVLKAGKTSRKIQRFCFTCPKNGSNKGGLYDEYQSGVEEKNSKYMEQKWGSHICRAVTKKDGRKDVKIYWKNVRTTQSFLDL